MAIGLAAGEAEAVMNIHDKRTTGAGRRRAAKVRAPTGGGSPPGWADSEAATAQFLQRERALVGRWMGRSRAQAPSAGRGRSSRSWRSPTGRPMRRSPSSWRFRRCVFTVTRSRPTALFPRRLSVISCADMDSAEPLLGTPPPRWCARAQASGRAAPTSITTSTAGSCIPSHRVTGNRRNRVAGAGRESCPRRDQRCRLLCFAQILSAGRAFRRVTFPPRRFHRLRLLGHQGRAHLQTSRTPRHTSPANQRGSGRRASREFVPCFIDNCLGRGLIPPIPKERQRKGLAVLADSPSSLASESRSVLSVLSLPFFDLAGGAISAPSSRATAEAGEAERVRVSCDTL